MSPDCGLALEHADRPVRVAPGELARDRQPHDPAADDREIAPRRGLRRGKRVKRAHERNCKSSAHIDHTAARRTPWRLKRAPAPAAA
jgi:hypothetical protein